MTWKQFKDRVEEQGVTDVDLIWTIDIGGVFFREVNNITVHREDKLGSVVILAHG